MVKRVFYLCLALILVLALAACGGKSGDTAGSGGSGSAASSAPAASGGKLEDGKWPTSIYSAYGVEELSTSGRVVYTELWDEGSYQYAVYYNGVTREELNAWVDKLLDKGFRMDERHRERLSSTWDYDIMLYMPQEKSPYRLRLAFDFGSGMSFEYYDDPNPAYVIEEDTDDYGDTYQYINYNVTISLNPLDTAESTEGSFEALGVTAAELKGVDNVRKIVLSKGSYMSSGAFTFYADHLVTEEEFDACRDKLVDVLAGKGAAFFSWDQELSPEEIKEQDIHSYTFALGDKRYMLMLDTDSEWGHIGGYYGFYFSAAN